MDDICLHSYQQHREGLCGLCAAPPGLPAHRPAPLDANVRDLRQLRRAFDDLDGPVWQL